MNETLPGYVEIYCAIFGCNDDKLLAMQVSDYKTDDTVLKFILGYNANNVANLHSVSAFINENLLTTSYRIGHLPSNSELL